MSARKLARLYDDLGRFQWWRRRLVGQGPGEGLEMHKRLRSDGPGGVDLTNLNGWIWKQLGALDPTWTPENILDLGAGFGATLFDWAQHAPGARLTGLGLSPYQLAKARGEARRLGLDTRAGFQLCDNAEFAGRGFDLLVSIETLFHAKDLAATFESLVQRLRAGGRLVLVEDMLNEPAGRAQAAVKPLTTLWSTPTLHTVEDYRDALHEAGLTLEAEHDLSAWVCCGDLSGFPGRRAKLQRWLAVCPLPPLREVLRAFLGGLYLEELHALGAMSYRAWFVRLSGADPREHGA